MASKEEILAGLAEIVNEETGLDTAEVQPEKSFTDDLDIDSISMMTIVVNAEDKFGVELYIVDGYGGHGIGREMHEEPYLANEGKAGRGPIIQEGSVLAIEPMLTLGTEDNAVLDDDWTVVTLDNSLAAHWEHTVAATENGPRILTRRYS